MHTPLSVSQPRGIVFEGNENRLLMIVCSICIRNDGFGKWSEWGVNELSQRGEEMW